MINEARAFFAKPTTFPNYGAMLILALLVVMNFYNLWTAHVIKENQRDETQRAQMNAARGELIQISLYAALEGRKLNAAEIDRIKTIWEQSDLTADYEAK